MFLHAAPRSSCSVLCVSYMSLLPAGLQQDVVVVLSHRRVHVCQLGRGVLQHGQGLRGVAFIQGLVDQADGGDTCKYTSRRTDGWIKTQSVITIRAVAIHRYFDINSICWIKYLGVSYVHAPPAQSG